MSLDDLPSFFNSTPVSELTTASELVNMKIDFDAAFIEQLVEFCKTHKYQAAMVSQNRPILAAWNDAVISISDRNVQGFEMDDLFRLLISDEVQNDLNLAAKAERQDVVVTESGEKIGYKVVVSHEPGYPKAAYFRLTTVATAEVVNLDRGITDVFAGKHDGSMFEYPGFFNSKTFDEMLRFSTDIKASDVTVQPSRPVFARIGAEYLPITTRPLNTDEIERIVNHIYGPSGSAEVLGGYALDPAHEVFVKRVGRTRFRVNITGGRAQGGSSAEISLRMLPTVPIKLDLLKLEPELIDAVTNADEGLVLITGPTGSGKSTTMASFNRFILETQHVKIIEFSQPIEFIYDGVDAPNGTIWQTAAMEHIKNFNAESIFALCVANGMRRNPDIIIIGECRDVETMQNAVSASQSAHKVITTMHSPSVAETIRRAVNMFPHSSREQMAMDIMEQLRVICSQKLVPHREGGRVAVREYMVFGDQVRDAFLKEDVKNWPRLVRRLLAEEKAIGQTMAKGAMKLLRAGAITEKTYEKVASKGLGII